MDEKTQTNLLLRNQSILIDGLNLTETLINRVMFICTRSDKMFPVTVGTNNNVIINIALNHLINSLVDNIHINKRPENIIHFEINDLKRTYVNSADENIIYGEKRKSAILGSYINEFQEENEDEEEYTGYLK